MDIAVIAASLVVLMILTLKKVPVPIAALVSVVIMAVLTGSNLLTTLSDGYLSTAALFVQANWLILLTGVILSRVMDLTGAATAIAKVIAKRLGPKGVIPTVMIAGAVMAYGGIDGLALCFVLYPIALGLCRQANIPRTFIPAILTSALFTWVMCLPGAPVITNVNASLSLGTTSTAGAVVGIVSAVVIIALQLLYFQFALKRAAAKGEGFVHDDEVQAILARSEEMEASGSLPNWILSLLPVLTVVVCYNAFKLPVWVAMLAGSVVCLAVLFKNVDWKAFGQELQGATNQAAIITITAGMVVGIGGVITKIPGFNDMIGSIVGFANSGGNPLILWAVAIVVLSGLLTNGMVGLITALHALAPTFVGLGVNAEALHRVGVIASAVLDCMPYGGGVVAIFILTKLSYKGAYKHVALTAIVPMFVGLIVAIALASFIH